MPTISRAIDPSRPQRRPLPLRLGCTGSTVGASEKGDCMGDSLMDAEG